MECTPNDLKLISEWRVFRKWLKSYLFSRYDWFYWNLDLTLSLFMSTLLYYAIVMNDFFFSLYEYGDSVGKKFVDFYRLSSDSTHKIIRRCIIYVDVDNKFIHSFTFVNRFSYLHSYVKRRYCQFKGGTAGIVPHLCNQLFMSQLFCYKGILKDWKGYC